MKIDSGTINDLEILKNQYKGGNDQTSIFDYFNKTKSEAGRSLLYSFFQNPKKSIDEINEFQKILKDIIDEYPSFSEFINSINFDLVSSTEAYLNTNIIPTRIGNSILKDFIAYIYKKKYSLNHSMCSTGVSDLIFLIIILKKFSGQDSFKSKYLKEKFEQIQKMISGVNLKNIIQLKHNKVLSNFNVFHFDYIFRNNLKQDFIQLIHILVQFDMLNALVKSIIEYKLTFPEFVKSSGPFLSIKGLYHMFIKQPVKNSLSMNDRENFLFLTGPNMAGKTTFMKSCGIAVYLAYLGIGVPAEKMRLSYYDSMISSVNTEDNIHLGYSYFYSEVMRIKDVAQLIRNPGNHLVLLDELFKGTNVKDAYNASLKIIKLFKEMKNTSFIVSTHIVEIEKDIRKFNNFIFNCFDASIKDGKPYYDYTLKEGVSSKQLGLIILENEGIFDLLKGN